MRGADMQSYRQMKLSTEGYLAISLAQREYGITKHRVLIDSNNRKRGSEEELTAQIPWNLNKQEIRATLSKRRDTHTSTTNPFSIRDYLRLPAHPVSTYMHISGPSSPRTLYHHWLLRIAQSGMLWRRTVTYTTERWEFLLAYCGPMFRWSVEIVYSRHAYQVHVHPWWSWLTWNWQGKRADAPTLASTVHGITSIKFQVSVQFALHDGMVRKRGGLGRAEELGLATSTLKEQCMHHIDFLTTPRQSLGRKTSASMTLSFAEDRILEPDGLGRGDGRTPRIFCSVA